jgi:6-pyruvoyltetrahydropterin/6-carboxytetrahydropterin synthase
MHHLISKEFSFCYGHRVHNQELIEGLAEDTCLACRHLHGHQGNITVTLRGKSLKNGMVTDFKHLGWFRRFVDGVLDHKMILDVNDPILNSAMFMPSMMKYKKEISMMGPTEKTKDTTVAFYNVIDVAKFVADNPDTPQHIIEVLEGYVFVNFVPTSENLARWLYIIVNSVMYMHDVHTESVTLSETPKSHATYVG